MINYIYQLVSPKVFSVVYQDTKLTDQVLVRPRYMAICHADQRYYLGQRDSKVLRQKLPMALIHECCGEVIYDPTGSFQPGQRVVLIPNTPTRQDEVIYENYAKGALFRSSGYDGFLQEFVSIPADRAVACDRVPGHVAAITEFVSVGVHACTRFDLLAHSRRKVIGVWGDGSLAYVLSCILTQLFPESEIVVVGKNPQKLSQFSFVERTYLADNLPDNFEVDHSFECAGGEGSYYAIEDIIRTINPQGLVTLMGVSENRVAIDTRHVLEKGLTLVGCSRSGRMDFERAVELMSKKLFQDRLSAILYEEMPVCSVEDIHRVFTTDLGTPFKTVFEWKI